MDRHDLLNIDLGVDQIDISSCRTDRSELDLAAANTSMASTFVGKMSAQSAEVSKSRPSTCTTTTTTTTTTTSSIIITKSSMSRRRKLKRTVSFATKATATIIASLDDMPEREKEALWRTPEDRKEDELNIVQTVKAYRKAMAKAGSKKHVLPPDMTPRGIEHLVNPENRERLRQRRERMVDAVLDLQDDYWNRGAHLAEPVALRTVSMKHTAADVEEAIKKAASDEAYVRRLRRMEGFNSLTSKSFLELSKKIPTNK